MTIWRTYKKYGAVPNDLTEPGVDVLGDIDTWIHVELEEGNSFLGWTALCENAQWLMASGEMTGTEPLPGGQAPSTARRGAWRHRYRDRRRHEA